VEGAYFLKRADFHKLFKSPGPVVLPVIHVMDTTQTERNIRIAIGEGAAGVFLINHDFGIPEFLPIIRRARGRFPALWMGVNFLAMTGREAFPVLAQLQREGVPVDGYWADDARIDETRQEQPEAEAILQARGEWRGFYTGGVCFKKQREVPEHLHETAARIAAGYMDAVCTSGVATGKAVDFSKIETFRRAIGETALTLASGITPENAHHYARDVDGFMVATGINCDGDFYNIDPAKLKRLMKLTRDHGANA
jgi:uncharacterized protein